MNILNINFMDWFYNFIESSNLQIDYGVQIAINIICATIWGNKKSYWSIVIQR
jgi:hypothetical protein